MIPFCDFQQEKERIFAPASAKEGGFFYFDKSHYLFRWPVKHYHREQNVEWITQS